MRAKIYQFLGDGGYIFSMGFSAFGTHLINLGYEVQKFPDSGRNPLPVVDDVLAQPKDRPIIFLGYSLGANGCAWNAHALRNSGRDIALIVGWDPTVNGPPLSQYPIGRHVKRCICFQQIAWWLPTSFFAGRGVYVRKPDGPKIEIKKTTNDHLLVQFDGSLQQIATEAIKKIQ